MAARHARSFKAKKVSSSISGVLDRQSTGLIITNWKGAR